MTIKPFAIQGADLTLGGVNLQAGTTGVVIPGVTQATSYLVEEVNDTGDQTYSNFPIDTEGEVVVIDAALYDTIVAQGDERHFADYTVTTDGEGYIDEIQVNGQGAYTGILAGQAQSFDMYAYVGAGSASDRPLVPQDWTPIPFRPKMRAGAIETIGGGGASITYREVSYPTGQEGDTAGTIAVDQFGNAYICIADSNGNEPQSYTVQQSGSFNITQTGDKMILTITDNSSDEADVIDLWATRETAIPTGWTISGSSLGGTYEAIEISIWTLGSQEGLRYIVWQHRSNDPTTISDGDEFTVTYSPGSRHIWTSISKAEVLETQDSAVREESDSTSGQMNLVIGTTNNVIISTNEGDNEFTFTTNGGLKFPDGTTQTTAYTGQAGGGSGELYIMANVDGNIITSTDGVTWGDPVPSGVPVIDAGGPSATGIGKLDVHGGVIVYTRADAGTDSFPPLSGLYYSTEIGTATLCVGTDAGPGGDLYWNEVHFFHETDTWVAVGYRGLSDAPSFPMYAYSTDGISWTVGAVDSTFVSEHNVGNWPWMLTDVAYNPTDAVYVFVGKVGGGNYAGAFVTNNLTVTFDASIWVDVNMNARYIVSWPVSGGPVTGYMMIADANTSDFWGAWSPINDSNNWSANFDGSSGWYQDAVRDAVGYVPAISEVTANGNSVVITTADGQVVVPTFGPMFVTIPLPYTATINDISRTNGAIDTFDVSPTVGFQNNNWTTFDQVVLSGGDSFHIVIDGTGTLVTCDLDTSAKKHNIGDVITLYGGTFGGTSGVDDIVITVTGTHHPITTITFTGDQGIANNSGEKIVISGVTSHTENGTTTEQSYNGTYYVKRIDNGGDPATYELYTDQACTTPWDTSTYWPVNLNTGTLTWSHGQFFDAAGCANSYYFIGNDDEQIFRSIDNGITWVQQADLTGGYLNDFAYGTWGSGASTSGTVTIESPFVLDLFGPEVYFVKDNYGSQVDNIDTNVAITRGNAQGIYNPITNPDWNDNTNGPTNTEWNADGWGDLSNVKTRYYDTWQNMCSGGINSQNREFVMHDTQNDKYYAIKFLTFQGGANGQDMGGGFSYVRKLINTECWFNRADGDDSGLADTVGSGLWIVRGQDGGIYNVQDEGGWNDSSSPSGTLWNAEGWSDLSNITTRQYLPLYQVAKHALGKVICGLEFVMKDTINNKYYAIKFSYWGMGGNGNGGNWPGFGYTRREIDLTKVSHNVKFADGSIQTTAVTEQRLGVLPQKLVDTNQDRYLTLDDIGKHLFVTQSGTYLRINDSTRQEFPVGAVITIINKSGSDIYIYKDNDDENGTIYGSNQNASSNGWYINDTGSGNMVTIIKIAQYYDGYPYSDWMIAGAGIGTD